MCWLLARLNHRDRAVAMWKKNTMLPFKAANPFSLLLKSPLSTRSPSPALASSPLPRALAPVFSAGRMEIRQRGDGEMRNEGGGETGWGIVRVGVNCLVMILLQQVGGRRWEEESPQVSLHFVTRIKCAKNKSTKLCDLQKRKMKL